MGKGIKEKKIEFDADKMSKLISEICNDVDLYKVEDLLKRCKSVVLLSHFKSKEEYIMFFDKLKMLFESYEKVLAEGRMALNRLRKNEIGEMDNTLNIFYDLMTSFPDQIARVVLLHIYLRRENPSAISESIRFLRSKDVFIEFLTQDEHGYRYIDIVTTQEFNTTFLSKQHEEGNNGRLRDFSKEEKNFLEDADLFSAFKLLASQDWGFATKDSKYCSALILNCVSYITCADKKNDEERSDIFRTMVASVIQYLDLRKLKVLMLYRTVLSKSSERVSGEKEALIRKLLPLINRKVKIKVEKLDFNIVDLAAIEFGHLPRKDGKESKDRYSPVGDLRIRKKKLLLTKGIDISATNVIDTAERYLIESEIDKVLSDFENGTLSQIDIDLKKIDIIQTLKILIVNRVKTTRPEADKDELNKLGTEYALNFFEYLYRNKKIDIRSIKMFDEFIASELIGRRRIEPSSEMEIINANFSKERLLFICENQPEIIPDLLNSNQIAKQDFLNMEHISSAIITVLYNLGLLEISEILDLVVNKKVTVDEIKRCEFDKGRLAQSLNIEDAANVFIVLEKNRISYEQAVNHHIECEMAQGIDEKDVSSLENKDEMQSEIQSLIDQKNAYLFLFGAADMDIQTKNALSADVFLNVLGQLEYSEFCRVAGEMYQSGFISLDMIRLLEPQIITELIKSFTIKSKDLEKFKETTITDDDLERLRKDYPDERKFEQEVNKLRYRRLEEIMNSIITDSTISSEEKLGIIYNVYSGNTEIENLYIDFYEQVIFTGKLDTKFAVLHDLYGENPGKGKKKRKKTKKSDEKIEKDENNYIYPARNIWKFMKLIDPDVSIKVYKDGNVVFRSEKFNKVVIESVWNGEGEGIKRSYGVSTISMDLETFDKNFSKIVIPSRDGYKIDTSLIRNELLPHIPANNKQGFVLEGLIKHIKDLKHTGKDVWFDLLLDNFGINLKDIKEGKSTVYTPEIASQIEEFLKVVRYSHERI